MRTIDELYNEFLSICKTAEEIKNRRNEIEVIFGLRSAQITYLKENNMYAEYIKAFDMVQVELRKYNEELDQLMYLSYQLKSRYENCKSEVDNLVK